MRKLILLLVLFCSFFFYGCASPQKYSLVDRQGNVIIESTDKECIETVESLANILSQCIDYTSRCQPNESF